MLTRAEELRKEVAALTPRAHKSAMGQFMTPTSTASFMAGMFSPFEGDVRLLDPGAGLGALTCATVDRFLQETDGMGYPVQVVAYELDPRLAAHLAPTLAGYRETGRVHYEVRGTDFIADGVLRAARRRERFTHAILNPPYKKISTSSAYRAALRAIGVETVNLYSGFVAVALSLLESGGELVAIIPRSWCNGPYYRPFREFLLERAALCRLHLFESRDRAFSEDEVLQENVILLLKKDGVQGDVVLSMSKDDTFADLAKRSVPFTEVVKPNDSQRFIRIAVNEAEDPLAIPSVCHTLAGLGLEISTGPVVDFRLKEHLLSAPTDDTAPLLYASHCTPAGILWPNLDGKKPNAIRVNPDTTRWLMPQDGWYVVTRRFSSKEERRRVVATLVDPHRLGGCGWVGFENHLNVFHQAKRGMPEGIARGLTVFLNSTVVDGHFRRFNGHTQVNATDLRSLLYPSKVALSRLGAWHASLNEPPNQNALDREIEKRLHEPETEDA